WSGYLNDLLNSSFGLSIPLWLRLDYRTFVQKGFDLASVPHIGPAPVVFNLPAVLIVLALTALLVRGVRESSTFNNFMVCVKLLVLALFVGIGLYYSKAENWTPFAPGGWKGIQAGAATIFFAYIGFDAVSTVAEETRDPKRDMPIGIIGSLVICTVVYILVTIALTGMMPFMELKDKIAEPLIAGLDHNHAPGWTIAVVALGSVIAHTAVLFVFQMGQPRILFSMSRDGLLPPYFARVHGRFRTPHVSTIWTGIFVAGLAALCNIDEMANLCNIGTLFAFVLVCAGVIVLRVKDPHRVRPFRAPGGYATPVLGIVLCLFLMFGLDRTTWFRFFGWLALGLAIYYAYGRKNSRLGSAGGASQGPVSASGAPAGKMI
ncbi:MAG TPA: amino acid permease, partial [Elusimicrobiales bacterium]|nr:amino acid permease [Elusimicrobiales bacterium]